jgi:four helix bundle protein
MDAPIAGFEKLETWKQARIFRQMTDEVCRLLPKEERYRLGDQLKRSAGSITANIAEGHGRFHYIDNIKFCRYARGSLNESLDHLITAFDQHYIGEDVLISHRLQYEKVLKLLNGYICYLKNQHTK